MASLFVSSRMDEVYLEREKIVELVRESGHVPLFFEVEPIIDDPATARRRVDGLLAASDALIQIHYLSIGAEHEEYGHCAPIEYEFESFWSRRPGPVILLVKKPREGRGELEKKQILGRLTDRIERSIKGSGRGRVVPVDSQGFGLREGEALIQALQELFPADAAAPTTESNGFVIQYSGPDAIGLLKTLSGTMFHSFRLNIVHLSYAAIQNHASACFHCISPRNAKQSPIDPAEVQRHLAGAVREAHQDLSAARVQVEHEAVAPDPWLLSAVPAGSQPPDAECYLEILHYDLPGQVYAISRAISTLGLNIDEVSLHPHRPDDDSQRLLRMWISKPADEPNPCTYPQLIRWLETSLSRLIGVRCATAIPLHRGIH